ncbi:MAG TPA: DUF1294 domain-containing protein [Methanoregula sp.]|nr:DUF1294 domain-containing protein [Methanoregula sp.]
MNALFLTIAAVLALVNGGSFLLYGADKIAAVFSRWRVPERRLIAASAVGPFGACAGMVVFRHKIRNPRFALVPVFVALQLAAITGIFIVYHPVP